MGPAVILSLVSSLIFVPLRWTFSNRSTSLLSRDNQTGVAYSNLCVCTCASLCIIFSRQAQGEPFSLSSYTSRAHPCPIPITTVNKVKLITSRSIILATLTWGNVRRQGSPAGGEARVAPEEPSTSPHTLVLSSNSFPPRFTIHSRCLSFLVSSNL